MTNRTRNVAVALTVAAVAAGGALAAVKLRAAAADRRKADAGPPIAIAVSELPPEASIWIDVHAPAKVWKVVRSNAWVAKAMSQPLGLGAGADWAGFFATKGGDLANAFDGVVLDVFADRLLAEPFRVVFFAGPAATGAPAIVVPLPSAAARGAFDVLDAAARKGRYEAAHCPGAAPKAGAPAPAPLGVSRWLIADQALFAAERDGRIALARNPTAVVQALCAAPPDVPAAQGVDLSMSFSRDALGREAQLAAALLGLGPAPRLAFAIDGDRLEPRGLLGDLSEPGRVAAGAPPAALLKLVPADAGVVFVATLRLPEKLTRETLAEHLHATYRGAYAPRPIAIVWNPHGDAQLPTDVAVIWPARDEALLRDAFSGPNRMERRRACGHVVLASTGALAAAMEKACGGQRPSILAADPAVARGLAAETSVTVGVNVGGVLSRVLADAWAADPASAGKAAPEVDAARKLLEELPFVGLRGVAKQAVLVPGGFRS